MGFKIMLVALMLGIGSTAYAGCIGSIVNGQCMGTYSDNPNIGTRSNENSGYQGSSGSHYQYDLNDPSDKLDYSIDIDAQRRDEMNLDPGRSIDRGLGENGGGIYSN